MTEQAMSPLRRRMIEDMTIRKLAPRTQEGAAQARQRALQEPQERDGSDGVDLRSRLRQQP